MYPSLSHFSDIITGNLKFFNRISSKWCAFGFEKKFWSCSSTSIYLDINWWIERFILFPTCSYFDIIIQSYERTSKNPFWTNNFCFSFKPGCSEANNSTDNCRSYFDWFNQRLAKNLKRWFSIDSKKKEERKTWSDNHERLFRHNQ